MFTRVLLGVIALFALTFASGADEPKETKLKPTIVFSGTHSAIQEERLEVITNEKDWKKLWKAHQGDSDTRLFSERDQSFDADFDTHYVVAVFFDRYPDGMINPRQRGDIIVIGYKGLNYQTEGGRDRRSDIAKAKEATSAPYAFIVLPKPVKTVVMEEDVQRELGKPPIWKERKRFPAPKAK